MYQLNWTCRSATFGIKCKSTSLFDDTVQMYGEIKRGRLTMPFTCLSGFWSVELVRSEVRIKSIDSESPH